MPKLIVTPISTSPNISLYPSLFMDRQRRFACAWYEYSSKEKPTPSDIWFSRFNGSDWSDPINISGNISYNNGPSICFVNDFWLVAWHSWRKPGREPFKKDGDICNIWASCSSNGKDWYQVKQCVPSFKNTNYPSLTHDRKGNLILLFNHRQKNLLGVSKSRDGVSWDQPEYLNGIYGNHVDIAIDYNNRYIITYVRPDSDGEIMFLKQKADGKWEEPISIIKDESKFFTRPKVSIDSDQSMWITCQSNNWGSYIDDYKIAHAGGILKIQISADNSPGNSHWALNSLEIKDKNHNSCYLFDFGPDDIEPADKGIRVGSKNYRYTTKQGWGFDKPVFFMLRRLGTSLTKTLVHNKETREFNIELDPGEYDINLTYSSWIASRPGTSIKFESRILSKMKAEIDNDKVFIYHMANSQATCEAVIGESLQYDVNRPSKMIIEKDTKKRLIAYSSFGPESVKILGAII